MVQILVEEKQIDLTSIYIDGTKIEAYANRYSFVWRGSIEKYQESLEIMGEERNSYSKTDYEATFMRMKEDLMKNGQLKPEYNIQLASASGFIIGENISHHPSDMYTLKPFLKELLETKEW